MKKKTDLLKAVVRINILCCNYNNIIIVHNGFQSISVKKYFGENKFFVFGKNEHDLKRLTGFLAKKGLCLG